MLLLRANTWDTVVAVVVTVTLEEAFGTTVMTIVATLTETHSGNVGTATRTAGMRRTAIPMAVTTGTGVIVAALLHVAGTRLTTGGAGAILGAHPVVAARLLAVTTMLRPPALYRRPTASLAGNGLMNTCAAFSWKKRPGTRVSVGNAEC